jgi:hypothetical protein
MHLAGKKVVRLQQASTYRAMHGAVQQAASAANAARNQ